MKLYLYAMERTLFIHLPAGGEAGWPSEASAKAPGYVGCSGRAVRHGGTVGQDQVQQIQY